VRVAVQNLSVSYGHRRALDGVSLTAEPGEILGVIGPNGSGKSSLVKAIAGVVPVSGRVLFDGGAMRPQTIGYMPQDNNTRSALSVLETVLLGRLGGLGLRVRDEDLAAAEAILEETGIRDLAGRDLGALSGGQRQLVFLAQALASHPAILLLDEPLSALDIRHQLEVIDLVRRLTRVRGLTTIMVLHDLSIAARISDRLAVLRHGCLLASGAPLVVLQEDILEKTFGVIASFRLGANGDIVIGDLRLPGIGSRP
jgi:iron complex transport system ATP-binding protein